MPRLSEKIKIEHTKYDRKIKLSDEQKDKIISLRGVASYHSVAREFGVCRRTIQFLWYPERHEKNLQDRKARGGSKQYYDRVKWKETMKEHRQYKEDLKLQGFIA